MEKIDTEDIEYCLNEVKEILESVENVVQVNGDEIYVVGDLHGDMESLKKISRLIEEKLNDSKFVFLGDYVDRGGHSTEVICYLLNKMLEEPNKIVLLRGNHETMVINKYYGFYSELMKKYGEKGIDLHLKFNETFSYLPISALINGSILALHGGIPKTTSRLDDFNKIPKGDLNGEDPTLLHILWNDPSEDIEEWSPSPRGEGIFLFGPRPFEDFIKKNGIEKVIRAHSFFIDGFKYFFDNRLLSLFSTLDYVGYRVNGRIAKINDKEISIISISDL